MLGGRTSDVFRPNVSVTFWVALAMFSAITNDKRFTRFHGRHFTVLYFHETLATTRLEFTGCNFAVAILR